MKTTKTILAVCILAGLTILGGCEKSGKVQNGKTVRFTARSDRNGVTKSSYSGTGTFNADGFLTWERIDWADGDEIRVASNFAYVQDLGDGGLGTDVAGKHFADYTVGDIHVKDGDPNVSQATMKPYNAGSNGLVWDDNQTDGYEFYAVYPCPFSNDCIALDSGDAENAILGNVTAFIPEKQTLAKHPTIRYVSSTGAVAAKNAENEMELYTQENAPTDGYSYSVYQPDSSYAFMTAATKEVTAKTKGVVLSFKPAYTSFEFNITNQAAENLTITKIELESSGANDYLSGEYAFMAGADFSSSAQAQTVPTVSIHATEDDLVLENSAAASKTVGMDLGESGLVINQAEGISLTLFTVPKANTGIISLKVTTKENGVATLPLKANETDPFIFTAGQKHRVNLLKIGSGWSAKVILDLEDEDLPWTYIATDDQLSQDYPKASQFTIDGAENVRDKYDPYQRDDKTWKKYRQYWDVTAGQTVTIDFQIMSPVSGTWSVALDGPGASAFTLSGNGTGDSGLSGKVDAEGDNTTKIRLTLTPPVSASGIQVVYIRTTVTDADENINYSLDSETQLYDLRGYHYFVLGATEDDYREGNVNVN